MVEANASMYLGSPRMAEMVIGEKVTLEEMGGARMHCEVSGCGAFLMKDEPSCLEAARRYLSYLPQNGSERPAEMPGRPPAGGGKRIDDIVPAGEKQAFDMYELINAISDEGS